MWKINIIRSDCQCSRLNIAFPGATILTFDRGKIEPVDYQELEHVRITKSFLDDPERYLKYLLE